MSDRLPNAGAGHLGGRVARTPGAADRPATSAPNEDARPTAKRLLIERELTAEELESIGEFCRLRGLPLDRWHHVPLIRSYFETLAASRIAARLRDEGETAEGATLRAALRLGIGTDALRVRFHRLRRQAFDSQVA